MVIASFIRIFGSLFLSLTLAYTLAVASEEESSSVASQFKAPNANTPPELVRQWKQQDEALWSYVEAHVPDVLEHTGSSAFDEHLKGVQAVERFWEAPEHLTNAALFHSIYGTEGFAGFALPLSERNAVRSIIGEKAEKLCFIFCMVDRSTVDKTVLEWKQPVLEGALFTFHSRPEVGRFNISLSKTEWLDFIELTLADWLEQCEGAASKPLTIFRWKKGEAYSYRRLAYGKMSHILAAERPERLGNVVPAMLQAVMATESLKTRHLVQSRTPPMSEAAAQALAALRSIGEDFPEEDFWPQPLLLAAEEEQACAAT